MRTHCCWFFVHCASCMHWEDAWGTARASGNARVPRKPSLWGCSCCFMLQVAVFSPDGTMLVTGSTDGFIEVSSGRVRGALCSRKLQHRAPEPLWIQKAVLL